jgi:hypothetical protein
MRIDVFCWPTLLFATVIGVSSCAQPSEIDETKFYAPKVFSQEEVLTITIPVEVAAHAGKIAFVKLFEHYGFSGNGPAIEQVVRYNLPEMRAQFDSEGDAFFARFRDKREYLTALEKLQCMEDVKCLSTWLRNASAILLKE